MAIEWLVGLDCKPKQLVGTERLVSKVKAQRQAEGLLDMVRAQGDTRDPAFIVLTTVRTGPDGEQVQTQVSLAELLRQGDNLPALATACEGCPANVLGAPFGCYGSVAYPITEATEQWLLQLLPEDLESTAGTFLTGAIADFSYDGAPVARLRNGSGTFFESDTSAASRWEDGTTVTADQVLQMLFFVGAVLPSHAMMLALFFGIVPHTIEPDALRALMRDDAARRQHFVGAKLPTGEGPQIAAFRTFLDALCRAVLLQVPLGIDA